MNLSFLQLSLELCPLVRHAPAYVAHKLLDAARRVRLPAPTTDCVVPTGVPVVFDNLTPAITTVHYFSFSWDASH